MRYKTALLAIACSIALAPAGAAAQQITLGVKGGLNSANLSVDAPEDPDTDFDSQTDFLAGAFAQFGFGSVFAIQPEVHYSQRGAKSRDTDPAVKLNLDYIDVPLLLMARLGSRESPLYPILYAGPSVAFETRCNVSGEVDGTDVSFDCSDPQLEGAFQTTKTSFGLVFGGGFEILYSRLTVQLDARYNLGLTNLNDADDAAQVSVKNRTWSFMLGLGIPVG
ncbi:MAG: porin family protein [Gemmatimonadales bacterium]|jgi:hypothetical protein